MSSSTDEMTNSSAVEDPKVITIKATYKDSTQCEKQTKKIIKLTNPSNEYFENKANFVGLLGKSLNFAEKDGYNNQLVISRKSRRQRAFIQLHDEDDFKTLTRSLRVKNHIKLQIDDCFVAVDGSHDAIGKSGEDVVLTTYPASGTDEDLIDLHTEISSPSRKRKLITELSDEIVEKLKQTELFSGVAAGAAGTASSGVAAAIPRDYPFGDPFVYAICDSCNCQITGNRYTCAECEDFDLCESCKGKSLGDHGRSHVMILRRVFYQAVTPANTVSPPSYSDVPHVHAETPSPQIPVFPLNCRLPRIPSSDTRTSLTHQGIHCVSCAKSRGEYITGTRYKCLECDGYDLCGTCFDIIEHAHPMVALREPINKETLVSLQENYGLHDVTHMNVYCDSCETVRSIKGIRYKCTECDDFDLCEACFKKGICKARHNSNHIMVAVRSTSLAINAKLQKLAKQEPADKKPESVKPEIHTNIVCDKCYPSGTYALNPIIGTRYRCLVCNNFDLCEIHTGSHDPNHPMIRISQSVRDSEINSLMKKYMSRHSEESHKYRSYYSPDKKWGQEAEETAQRAREQADNICQNACEQGEKTRQDGERIRQEAERIGQRAREQGEKIRQKAREQGERMRQEGERTRQRCRAGHMNGGWSGRHNWWRNYDYSHYEPEPSSYRVSNGDLLNDIYIDVASVEKLEELSNFVKDKKFVSNLETLREKATKFDSLMQLAETDDVEYVMKVLRDSKRAKPSSGFGSESEEFAPALACINVTLTQSGNNLLIVTMKNTSSTFLPGNLNVKLTNGDFESNMKLNNHNVLPNRTTKLNIPLMSEMVELGGIWNIRVWNDDMHLSGCLLLDSECCLSGDDIEEVVEETFVPRPFRLSESPSPVSAKEDSVVEETNEVLESVSDIVSRLRVTESPLPVQESSSSISSSSIVILPTLPREQSVVSERNEVLTPNSTPEDVGSPKPEEMPQQVGSPSVESTTEEEFVNVDGGIISTSDYSDEETDDTKEVDEGTIAFDSDYEVLSGDEHWSDVAE